MEYNTLDMKSLPVIRTLMAVAVCIILSASVASAQGPDRRDVRKGNRDFRKEDYKSAEIDYRKALVKDSTSFAANYNLGNTLYRMGDMQQAAKYYEALGNAAQTSPYAADYYYNTGNAAASQKDWKSAVESYRQSLLRNPADLEAKENYIYAKKMLENQQNQQNQDQNQDNKDNQNNQDNQNNNQDKDQNKDNSQNQDQNQDQNGQGDQDRQDQSGQQGQQPKITPQAAQQMLQAIQAKEKETQEKVKKEKAQALKSRQKEKNW